VLFADFWGNALNLPDGPWSHPFQVSDPVHTPYGLDTSSPAVQPASPYYDDQTKLFSARQWATAYFCPAQVAAHAVSVRAVSGR
jgi:acyl-homoserine lactone acylase PvdQ